MASCSRQPREHYRTIKVTILASEWGSRKGGLSTINRELAIQLAKFPDVEVTLFLPKCSHESKKEAQHRGLSVVEAEKRPGYKELDWLSSPPDDLRIDLVVGHGVELGRQAQFIRNSHKCRWVQVVHTDPEELGMFKSYESPISKGEQKHRDEVELCEMADLVVGVGPKLTEAFRKYLSWCKKDQDFFELTPGVFADFACVEHVSFKRKHFSVLVFGPGDSEDFELQGFEIAARSVAALPDITLVFVGAPAGSHVGIAKRFLDLGFPANRLKVRGYTTQEALKQLFCEVDLVLMSSRTEGFGLGGLEGLSAGLPVIVSKNSGFGEVLGNVPHGSSFVIESEDPSAWTAAIKSIWKKERQLRLDEAKVLREFYGKKYGWSEQCKNLLEKMVSLLENRQDASRRSQILVQQGEASLRRGASIEDRTERQGVSHTASQVEYPLLEFGDASRTIQILIQQGEMSLRRGASIEDRTERQGVSHTASQVQYPLLEFGGEAADRAREGDAYFNLGIVYESGSDLPKAIECYEKSLIIAREAGDRAREGKAYLKLGIVYNSRSDLPKDIECFEKASNIAREAGDRATEGETYCNLGVVYNSRSDLPKAIECYEKSLHIAREAGDRAREGKAYLCLAILYNSCNDLPKAIECYEKSLPIAGEACDQATERIAYLNLGILYNSRSDLSKAIECYEKALNIAKKAADRAGVIHASQYLEKCYMALGDFLKASEYREKILKIFNGVTTADANGGRLSCSRGESEDKSFDLPGNIVEQPTPETTAKDSSQIDVVKPLRDITLAKTSEKKDKSATLPGNVVESLAFPSCDPKEIVHQFKENFHLEQTDLWKPTPETTRMIRCFAETAKNSKRMDVVKHLREITPPGTTGPLLPGKLDFCDIPADKIRELTIDLTVRDLQWKVIAERLGLRAKEIAFLDMRYPNPSQAALAFVAQYHGLNADDLYDVLTECGMPDLADTL